MPKYYRNRRTGQVVSTSGGVDYTQKDGGFDWVEIDRWEFDRLKGRQAKHIVKGDTRGVCTRDAG